jgi:homoserine dehydrogenase
MTAQPPATEPSQNASPRTIPIGLLGLGNVGQGVVRLLRTNAAAIQARLGARLEVRRIAVRERAKARQEDVPQALITEDVDSVLRDPAIRIVVELIGGVDVAARYVLEAISRGLHVVTANKAMLAERGDEIFAAAAEHGVDVFYEASVCGGLPVLRALREGLASDRVHELYGIVNGTSNFILTSMAERGLSFDSILADAQAAGYAEADPGLDVDGGDAAHKLAILVSLAFGAKVHMRDIHVEGIRSLEPVDFAYAERFGYVIKPLVRAREHTSGRLKGSIEAMVAPTLIPKRFLLAGVRDVFNAVYVVSDALGPSMYYGRGAGMMPTAVAVVSDLIEVGRDVLARESLALPRVSRMAALATRPFASIDDHESRYYLRFTVNDRPGVLAQLAGALGERQVSISEVVQDRRAEQGRGGAVPVVIITHLAREADVRIALQQIASLGTITEATRVLRIAE